MLAAVFGLPSAFSYWTVAALRSMVDVCHASHRYLESPSLAKLREVFAEDERVPLVYFCDCPEADIVHAFVESGLPYLVCLESPTDVLGYCMQERAMRPADALRFTAQCFSSLHDLALGPKAKVQCRRLEWLASDVVIEFCSTFRMTSDVAVAADAVSRLTGLPDFSDVLVETLIQRAFANSRPLGAYSAALPKMGVPEWIVDTANQFAPLLEGKPIDSAFWPREAFLDPHGEAEVVSNVQELTGPSRHLIFGPFLHLPPGRWRATFSFEVGDGHASALMADIAIMAEPVTVARFDLPEFGKFEFFLEFESKEPRQFLEARIALLKGAIEGKFQFGGVRLQRLLRIAEAADGLKPDEQTARRQSEETMRRIGGRPFELSSEQ